MSSIENTTFNIVEFIEKNPLKKLNNTYQNILLNKIKEEFNEKEQDLFVTSFYCYLNFNPTTDFVIDFDDVRKWCGFTRKDNAKRLLEKYFTQDIDYIVNMITPPNGGVIIKERGGAHKKEKILLNIKTFKKFCLKSDTKKADEIHNYYIKLEEILQDILLQQTEELKLQLEMKNIELGEKNIELNEKNIELNEKNIKLEETEEEVEKLSRKYIKKPKLVSTEKNVVYLMSTVESEKKGEYIVGKATNLTERKENYDNNKLHDFKVIYNISCDSSKLMDVLESIILAKMGKYRCKKNRDVFLLPSTENTTLFINIFDTCLKFYEDVDDSCIVYPKRTLKKMDKDEMRKKNEIYQQEHKDKIKETNKEYYNDNKELLAEIKKVYFKNGTPNF